MSKREPSPEKEEDVTGIVVPESPLAKKMKISELFPDSTQSTYYLPELLPGKVPDTAETRQTRKRKRSVSPNTTSSSSPSDSSDNEGEGHTTPLLLSSSNPDAGNHNDNTTNKFKEYLDTLSQGCEALNIYGKTFVNAGNFTVDTSRPIDLSDPKLIIDAEENDDDVNTDDDSVSDHSNRDDEDSNAEDNWRNDYPDEEDFDNGDSSDGDFDFDE